MPPSTPESGEAGGKPEDSAARQELKEQRDTLRGAIDTLRTRVDLTAKALAAVGTTAVTAVGLARIGDLFPAVGWKSWTWFTLAIVGFLGLAVAVGYFIYRLWSVHQPLFMRADERAMVAQGDITAAEKEDVRAVYRRTAELNRAPSLRAYEARADRLERIAEQTPPGERRDELLEDADRIRGEIEVTLARAALRILRRRTTKAVTDRRAAVAAALFVLGLLLFALGTDYVSSQRTDEVTVAKSCADARKAGATTLPPICNQKKAGGKTNKGAQPPTPSSVVRKAQALTAALGAAATLASVTAQFAAAAGAQGAEIANQGRELVGQLFTGLALPLGKDALEGLGKAIWDHYFHHPGQAPPIVQISRGPGATINLTVIVRNARPRVITKVIQIPETGS
jgi:hypothetical protein